MTEQQKPQRRHHCAYCGQDLGIWDARYCDRNDTCGEPECNRNAREEAQAEREEAHDRLDRDMGW